VRNAQDWRFRENSGTLFHAMTKRLETFEEFWPYYVKEHSKKLTRQFHFVGTSLALGCFAGGLLTRHKWLLLVAPVAGYGPAWISHFFIEKNRPATFTYPRWSLMADFVMWGKMLAGTMDDEVAAVVEAERAAVPDASEIRPNVAPNHSVN
jgi:hypothetical protein